LSVCDPDKPDTPIYKADTLEDSGSGYGYLFYKNNSSDTTLLQNLKLEAQGILPLIAPSQTSRTSSIVEQGSNSYQIRIAPKDEGIVILRTFGTSFSYATSTTTQYLLALNEGQIIDYIK